MRVGQMLRIEADIIGEPPPIVTWKLKDAVLKSMDRLKIESEDYHTTFIMSKLQRSDTGTYTVIAKNDSGTDQVDVEIQVCELYRVNFLMIVPSFPFLLMLLLLLTV